MKGGAHENRDWHGVDLGNGVVQASMKCDARERRDR